MKILPTLTTLAVVTLAACEAGMTAPQTEADDPGATKLAALDNTERADVYPRRPGDLTSVASR